MGDDLEAGKAGAGRGDGGGIEHVVHDARAIGGDEFLVDPAALELVADVLAHEPVGHEEDTPLGQAGDDIVDVAGGDADIRLSLHVGRGIDVAHHRRIGIGGLELPQLVTRERIRERAAGAAVGYDNGGVGRKDLGRLGHEHDAGEDDHLGPGFARLETEKVGVALEVTDPVDDLRLDVGVGENDGVLFLFQAIDLQRERRDPPAPGEVPGATGLAIHI